MSTAPIVKQLSESGALIVGGTAGIGLQTALGLAERGVPRIAVVGRSADRGARARELLESAGAAA
ncbi:NAD(P)-dependent dehydrogenase (short-subunit alcohol dehydrogenase family) [Rhodococcus sp. LBL1]|nr:NAD(P)-dependent dehydrogenase (short-subunit alcohol dehydrogenase family) [Rhodococcus sp. LBL1]MDH6685084.1 NAD(P)-dependent dehydrogenase (short-subunit alcohol dehydrogenase family) [Rhodococcus sp. LBL2]